MTSSFENSESAKEWMDLQREYLQTWINMQRQVMEQSKPALSPAEEAKKQMEDFFKDLQRNMFGSAGMPYANSFGSDMFRNPYANTGANILDMLSRFNGDASKHPEKIAMEMAETMSKAMSDLMAGKKDFASFSDPMEFITSMPGVGYNRNKQDDMNELYKRWSKFQKVSYLYTQGMARIGNEASQAFQAYLINPPADAKPLETHREVLNKWVEISEGVYAKYATSEEYMKLYGDTVNALADFKVQLNKVADGFMDALGLPTRKEIDSINQYVHDLKRDNHKLKAELKEIRAALKMKPAAATAAADDTDKKGKK